MKPRNVDLTRLTDRQLVELLRDGSAEAVGRGPAMERTAREAFEQAVERRKLTQGELLRVKRLLARMVVETLGPGWKLTVGGRDLQVTIEFPGSRHGWGYDGRCHTYFHTGNSRHPAGPCTSNVGGNMATSVAIIAIQQMAVAQFTEVFIDCDALLKSDEGLPNLPYPADFQAALGEIRAGREKGQDEAREEEAVKVYGGWLIAMKSLRRLPEGTDPRGLRAPFVVAVVERPKTYGLGIPLTSLRQIFNRPEFDCAIQAPTCN